MEASKRFAEASKAKLASLESRLSGILKPVAPRREFVHGLGHRIQEGGRAAFVNRVANWHFLAMLAAGLVSLAIFLAVAGRALLSLLEKKRAA